VSIVGLGSWTLLLKRTVGLQYSICKALLLLRLTGSMNSQETICHGNQGQRPRTPRGPFLRARKCLENIVRSSHNYCKAL
jgi:hypothetical protein